jgi:dipeptidyl aminopeptidase/acylaminoacyl peptidase
MRKHRVVFAFLILALALTPALSFPARIDTQPGKRPLEMADILAWKRIQAPVISHNGQWLAYLLAPAEGDSEVVIRRTQGEKELRFPVGEAGFTPPSFSDDAKWLAFTIAPTRREAQRMRRARQPIQNKVALVNLETEKKVEFEKIRRFAFSGEQGGWIALQRYGADGGAAPSAGPGRGGPGPTPAASGASPASDRPTGTDLILYELATGNQLHIGNVAEFAFDKKGEWLAWIVDAQDKAGNGIQLRHMTTGAVLPLDSDKASYRSLRWDDKEQLLTALKGVEDKAYEDKLYSVVAFSRFAAGGPQKIVYDPQEDKSFPAGMTVSPNRAPEWTEDQASLLFGIHEVKKKKEQPRGTRPGGAPGEGAEQPRPEQPGPTPAAGGDSANEETPGVVIWHWQDKRLQPMQQVQENSDKNFSYLSIYHVADKKFIRLADEELRQVTVPAPHKLGIGSDTRAYEWMANLDGRRYQDVYLVDLKTGARKLALPKMRYFSGASPDGKHLLYHQEGHYFTYEVATGQSYNLTKSVPAVFWNQEDDHNVVKPPTRQMGWSKDGAFVLLSDDWDIWQVPAHGGQGINLTVNGKKDGIRYRARYRFDPDERGIDLSQPVYFGIYGEWTKKAGYARMEPGKPGPKVLRWEDAGFGLPLKARKADVYLYTRETFEEYPNYYVTDASLAAGQKLTEANPQQKNFHWSAGARLVNYASPYGPKLQGALYLPANYEPGKSYPTIVYMYEKLSQGLNSYTQPTANGFNKSVYTSHGYAVFMPDIVFKVNDPGVASTACILAGLKAAIETGVVDKDRVGIHGHSWGGYQTAFIVTQSDAFKAAVSGAPLTNMMSMYNLIYWNTGSANQPIFESSQGRFTSNPWENAEAMEAYRRNSPVAFAKNVKTPLIILHNDKDGAVDFTQGIEYFNTLRRMQKPVVMLQYKGENHGLAQRPNQKDYTVRMKEFFDHHLLGKPAPKWWLEGVPHLKLKDHLDERAAEEKAKSANPL